MKMWQRKPDFEEGGTAALEMCQLWSEGWAWSWWMWCRGKLWGQGWWWRRSTWSRCWAASAWRVRCHPEDGGTAGALGKGDGQGCGSGEEHKDLCMSSLQGSSQRKLQNWGLLVGGCLYFMGLLLLCCCVFLLTHVPPVPADRQNVLPAVIHFGSLSELSGTDAAVPFWFCSAGWWSIAVQISCVSTTREASKASVSGRMIPPTVFLLFSIVWAVVQLCFSIET